MKNKDLYMYAKHFQLVLYNNKVFDWDGNLLFKETHDKKMIEDSSGNMYKKGELVNFILENVPAH